MVKKKKGDFPPFSSFLKLNICVFQCKIEHDFVQIWHNLVLLQTFQYIQNPL